MTTMNNEDPADPSVHEQRELPEPAAWLYVEDPFGANEHHWMADSPESQGCDPREWTPLYTADQMREATLAEFAALLPGPYYMDPPDGGSVTVLEQFRRMALDAQRWRAQQEWISKAIACELRCEGGGDEILDGRNPNPPECDPRA